MGSRMLDWAAENLEWILGGISLSAIAISVRLWLELKREGRAKRRGQREEREALAPHIEQLWRTADALYEDFEYRCREPSRGPRPPQDLLDQFREAERSLLARSADKMLADAVEAYASQLRNVAGGRMTPSGRLRYPDSNELGRYEDARRHLRELTLRPK